ncbi:HAD hydrolase-like protein [Phenylobacterium sp. LjRoot219]|uniref:HAD hydrolase-like protein n=1 Tax=Phenylobacterium sp. LjRoot219 TaxID=3342283 RepID=UPI003ECD7F83
MYKLVIFDFDGTLADSAGWMVGELTPLAARFGFRQACATEIETLRGCDTRQILSRLGAPAWQLPFIAQHLRRRVAQDAETIQLFPGAKALLRRLAGQGVVLGLVSSNSAANVQRILGPEAAALIEHYACGAPLFGKAAQFRQVVRRARMKPSDTLCIGDQTGDIEAARQAGLACGAVAWGYARRELLAERSPTWLFETPDDVATRLAA